MSRQLVSPIVAVAAMLALLCASQASAETVAPLPPSNYAVRAACAEPEAGHAGCLALQLVPLSAEALRHRHPIGTSRAARQVRRDSPPTPSSGLLGLRPYDLHQIYGLPTAGASEQTVAIVDSYNDPTVEHDLETYDQEFGLPACTSANGCFRKVGQSGAEGQLPFPKTSLELEQAASSGNQSEEEEAKEAIGWGVEISLDVETVHATCQSCHILLVEASSTSDNSLIAAEATAERLGAQEVSNSWGSNESYVSVTEAEGPFNHPGTVITASAGDDGYREWGRHSTRFTSFPAASPHVVAVGGTRLYAAEDVWQDETVWNGAGASGGGCSQRFGAPEWQLQVADWAQVKCGSNRAVSDVAADADPYTGFVIRDSDDPGRECETPYENEEGGISTIPDWCTYGGTSLASPIIASVFALAGGAGAAQYPAGTLYESLADEPGTLHDVTEGSNGECGVRFNEEDGLSNCSVAAEASASCASSLACQAAPGYDGPSGVGTPDGIAGFEYVARAKPAAVQPAATSPAPAAAPVVPPVATTPAVQLSALSLTASALFALDEHRPPAAKIGFTFVLNVAVHLHVSLARRVRVRGHFRWVVVGHSIAFAGLAGRNRRSLSEKRRLTPGLYRLMLSPASGAARSIVFHIG
jgi:Subtilase family